MAYSYRNNGQIKDFWPDDDHKTIYIQSSNNSSMQDIIELIHAKWGQKTSLESIQITSESIHTSCLTYDCYDASDYTDFIIITKI